MAIVSRSHNYDDKSPTECKTRIVWCYGHAEATDLDRAIAARESEAESDVQRDIAISDAEAAINCPQDGCPGSQRCRQGLRWYTGNYIGLSTTFEYDSVTKIWTAKSTRHKERRLKCACVGAAPTTTQQQNAPNDEDDFDYADYPVIR
jgi:hypothetical protein